MATIARVVEKMVKENPSLEIALSKDIISYSKLARYLHAEVEKEFGKKVTDSAMAAALKRMKEKSGRLYAPKKGEYYALELGTSSNLAELSIGRTGRLPSIMKSIYEFPELGEGCIMHASHGNNQTTFVFSDRLERKMRALLSGEKLLSDLKRLAQLSIKFDEKMFRTTGFLVYVLKELAWNGIGVVEIVSTYTELIIIVREDDLMRSHQIAKGLLF